MAPATRNDCPLPSNFSTIRDVLDGKYETGSMIKLAGLVMDYRAPTATRGTDWKCQITVFDHSVEDSDESISIDIFRPQERMPYVECGDVVILSQFKVQCRPIFSLLSSHASKICVLEAGKMLRAADNVSIALRDSHDARHRKLSDEEKRFARWLYHSMDKSRMPSQTEFLQGVKMSTNVRDKFTLLQDVSDGSFVDMIAQVVKKPYDDGNCVTLWVSDYTENADLFNYAFHGIASAGWKGPFGQRSIQVTCYEPHASLARTLDSNAWLLLQNVHVKYGNNGRNLEGFLREDRGEHQRERRRIWELDALSNKKHVDPRLVDAIGRKRDYEKSQRQQIAEIAEAARAGDKRRARVAAADAEGPPNKKTNRRKQREAKFRGADRQAASSVGPETGPEVSKQVKCEHMDRPVSSAADLVQRVKHTMTIDGAAVDLELPFTNLNFRLNARVVDFAPSDLRRFARPVKPPTEFDVLGDFASSSSSSSSSTPDSSSDSDVDARPGSWEWRFMLKLQDASASLWVLVDNPAAQCLVNLDASDLTRDAHALDKLRHRLFLLWGNLEEEKRRQRRRGAGAPPAHSDDDGDGGLGEAGKGAVAKGDRGEGKVSNLPFACCVRQFGVLARRGDGARRWQRIFALFGTKICTLAEVAT